MKIKEAIKRGSIKLAKLAIAEEGVHVLDENGNQPLHFAAEAGKSDIIDLLITYGANINAQNKHGHTPLHKAVLEGHQLTIEILLLFQANPNIPNQLGYTTIHTAAFKNSLPIMKMLAQYGAMIDVISKNGFSVMHCTAVGITEGEENWALMDWLLEGDISPSIKDHEGRRPEDDLNDIDPAYSETFNEHILEIQGNLSGAYFYPE